MINSVQHKRGGGANLSARTYYRDERDRITAYQKSTANNVNSMEDGRGNHYQYDAEGQLTDAWYDAVDPAGSYGWCLRQDHFDYDALGNRRNWDYIQTKGWMHFLRRDNGLNQYTSWENSYPNPPQHWGSGIFHDDNSPWPGYNAFPGNGVTMADGWLVASYNALNQPVAMVPFGWANAIYFGYDPLGRCVKRWVGASGNLNSNPATYFYYDGWNLIQEGSSASDAQRQYVHGARVDEIVAQITPPNNWIRYFHYDASGNCTLQTDAFGNIVEQYEFDAFGYPYFFDGNGTNIGYSPWGNRFLFTGREWLIDLKLYDYRNRMYQPELGRFMQPDSKEFAAGDYNLYRYCHNDPVNKSDPFGLVPPADGLMDVSKEGLREMYKAQQDNADKVMKQSHSGTREEYRTDKFQKNNSGETKTIQVKGFHEGNQPKSGPIDNPFGKDGRRLWSTHMHPGSPARPYGGDKPGADSMHVPIGVGSTAFMNGTRMYLYVPSEHGGPGKGGEFYTDDGNILRDLHNNLVPH